ncbi:STE3-like pheromone receptor [Scleroderma citrinum]
MISSGSNTAFSALSFIGVILTLIPLPWHLQSWNAGTCMYTMWTSFGCLILFINSVVWKDNVINWAPVWCDIASHYLIGASTGIPASSLCIVRQLFRITKLETLSQERNDKWREICIDLLIGVGFPCLVTTLYYVVQGHRFNIYEQIGCWPVTYLTILGYFLVFMWPTAIGMISMVYAVLTFRQALIHRQKLKAMLQSSHNITTGHYCRLMVLCMVEVAFTVPLGIYNMVLDSGADELQPYISWENVHFDFSYVGQYPAVAWQSSPETALSLESSRWFCVLCALIFFMFFGWSREIREGYYHAFQTLVCNVGLRSVQSASKNTPDRCVSSYIY